MFQHEWPSQLFFLSCHKKNLTYQCCLFIYQLKKVLLSNNTQYFMTNKQFMETQVPPEKDKTQIHYIFNIYCFSFLKNCNVTLANINHEIFSRHKFHWENRQRQYLILNLYCTNKKQTSFLSKTLEFKANLIEVTRRAHPGRWLRCDA